MAFRAAEDNKMLVRAESFMVMMLHSKYIWHYYNPSDISLRGPRQVRIPGVWPDTGTIASGVSDHLV